MKARAPIDTAAPTPTTPARSAARTRFLQAAAEEFMLHGFANTTMDAVAARAGGSKRTLYHHFADKVELYKAVIHHLAQPKRHPIGDLTQDPRPPEKVLADAAKWIYELCMDEIQRSVARNCIAEAPNFPEMARVMERMGLQRETGTLAPLIAYFSALSDRGEIHLPPVMAADMFFILAVGGVRFLLEDHWPSQDRKRWVKKIVEVFMRGAWTDPPGTKPKARSPRRPSGAA